MSSLIQRPCKEPSVFYNSSHSHFSSSTSIRPPQPRYLNPVSSFLSISRLRIGKEAYLSTSTRRPCQAPCLQHLKPATSLQPPTARLINFISLLWTLKFHTQLEIHPSLFTFIPRQLRHPSFNTHILESRVPSVCNLASPLVSRYLLEPALRLCFSQTNRYRPLRWAKLVGC